MVVQLKNLEDALQEIEALDHDGGVQFKLSDDCYAETDGVTVRFPSFGITATEAVIYQQYEDGEYYPDWDATFIFKDDKEPPEYDYYEQDGVVTTLHNYLTQTGRAGQDTENLECDIKISGDESEE